MCLKQWLPVCNGLGVGGLGVGGLDSCQQSQQTPSRRLPHGPCQAVKDCVQCPESSLSNDGITSVRPCICTTWYPTVFNLLSAAHMHTCRVCVTCSSASPWSEFCAHFALRLCFRCSRRYSRITAAVGRHTATPHPHPRGPGRVHLAKPGPSFRYLVLSDAPPYSLFLRYGVVYLHDLIHRPLIPIISSCWFDHLPLHHQHLSHASCRAPTWSSGYGPA